MAAQRDARRQGAPLVAAARQHELELRPLPADEGERLQQPGVVLVRPRARRIEQEGLAWFVARAEQLVVDSVRCHVHRPWIEFEQLHGTLAHEPARDDHHLRPPCGPVVCRLAKHALPPREQRRPVEVQDVVERDGEWLPRLRERDRQRIVDGFGAVEPCTNPAGSHSRRAHCGEPLQQRARGPVLGDHLRRQTVPRVRRDGRQEGDVLELAVLRKRPRERPRIGLAAADRARNERQEREPDHRASLLAPCGQKVTHS